MNKLFLCVLFAISSSVAFSQKVYFVYIQSESDQPFFVKMNEKVNSSTGSGYLILSKLHDSSYTFSIGFPQNKWPEQNFAVSVDKKDHGYLLKNFGEKGWGLFDLQTMAIQMAITSTKNTVVTVTDPKNVSAFTDILSKAADDPTLKDKPAQPVVEEKKVAVVQPTVKKEEPKVEIKEIIPTKTTETVQVPVAKKEEIITEKKEVAAKPVEIVEQPIVKKEEPKVEVKEKVTITPIEIVEQPVVKEEPKAEVKEPVVIKQEAVITATDEYKKSIVTKKSESSTTEGFGLVFLDNYQNGLQDTIRLVIPNPKPVVPAVKEEPKEEKKFLDIPTDVKKEEATVVNKTEASNTAPVKKEIKNTCPAIADGSDFQKLRKNMAAANSDDDMINEAKNFFKKKCFTVHQLKNLAPLFLTDAGKYKFFDVAYSSASDVENFATLEKELTDEYYINRFKVMLR